MTRFFPSLLLLLFAMPCYLISTVNKYDRHQRYIRLNTVKPASRVFSKPIFAANSGYRNRYRLAKIRKDTSRLRRKMRQSFGVTSKFFRRSLPDNVNSQLPAPPKLPLYPLNTTGQVFAWTRSVPSGIATTILPPSPIWLPPQRTADPLTLILPNLFHLQNSPVDSTIIRLKQYLKKNKAINPNSTRTRQKTLKRGTENAQHMDSKDPKSGNMFRKPEARVYPIGKNMQKFDVINMASKKQQQSFVEKLADQIEAAEAERLASEADNPLKYTVKDGILYKKNKIPVARIKFPSMNMSPLTADRIQKVIRTEHANAVLKTPPMFSKRSALANSVNETANVRLNLEHKKPTTPLSSAPIRFWRDKAKASSAIGFDIDNGIQQVDLVPSFARFSTNLMEKSGSLHSNDIIAKIRKPPPYPFSHCYMNVDGFLCCNRYLESVMRQSYQKLRKAYRFNECSVQKIVNRIQTDCENAFNTTFETVVGIDDFAIRAHFVGDLLCKIHEGGRFIASYATMMPTREGVPLDPLHVVTNIEMNLRDKEALHPESVNDSENGIEPATQSDVPVQHVRVPNVPGFERHDQEDIPFYEKSRGDIDNHNMIIS